MERLACQKVWTLSYRVGLHQQKDSVVVDIPDPGNSLSLALPAQSHKHIMQFLKGCRDKITISDIVTTWKDIHFV